jgi:hypothetical protein
MELLLVLKSVLETTDELIEELDLLKELLVELEGSLEVLPAGTV